MVDFNDLPHGPISVGDTEYDRAMIFAVDPVIDKDSVPDELLVIQVAADARIRRRKQYGDEQYGLDHEIMRMTRQSPTIGVNPEIVECMQLLTDDYAERLYLDDLEEPSTPLMVEGARQLKQEIGISHIAFTAMRGIDNPGSIFET